MQITGSLQVTGSLIVTGSLVIPAQSGSELVQYPANPTLGTMLFYTSASVNELQIYNGIDWVTVGLTL